MRGEGVHVAAWDGTDEPGYRVVLRVYLYRLEAGDRPIPGRMVFLD